MPLRAASGKQFAGGTIRDAGQLLAGIWSGYLADHYHLLHNVTIRCEHSAAVHHTIAITVMLPAGSVGR